MRAARRNYKGRHPVRRRMPAWLQAACEAIGNGITYVLLSAVMQPRLFVAACTDYYTTHFGLVPSKNKGPVEV